MEEQQKKVIIRAFAILGILISLCLSIAWLVLVTKDSVDPIAILSWLYANFGSLTLGLIIKTLVNNKHKKEIKIIVEGEPVKIPKKLYNGFDITESKSGEVNIKDTLKRSSMELMTYMPQALFEYMEDKKKDLL